MFRGVRVGNILAAMAVAALVSLPGAASAWGKKFKGGAVFDSGVFNQRDLLTKAWEQGFDDLNEQLGGSLKDLAEKFGATYDADHLRSANNIARRTQAVADVYMKELAREMAPTADEACAAISASDMIGAARCSAEQSVTAALGRTVGGGGMARGARSSSVEQVISDDYARVRQAEAAGHSPIDASLITREALSEGEAEAAGVFADLVAGRFGVDAAVTLPEDASAATDIELAKALGARTEVARRSVSEYALARNIALRETAGTGHSTLQQSQDIAQMGFGSEGSSEWMAKMNDGQSMTKTMVIRTRAIMRAYELYQQLEAFRSSLVQEALLAVRLVENVEG